MTHFKIANSDQSVPGATPLEFVLKTGPNTDIWAKPPSTIRFNAPILYQTVPLDSFKRVRVDFNASWKHQYDQGGLVIVLHYEDGSKKWVKAGIELTHGKPHISVVSKDRWADWSLLPVPSNGVAATLEMAQEVDGSLWIYLVDGLEKAPIREVTWLFQEENVKECWVGVYAARPSEEGGDLEVNFRDWNLEKAY
ncbi:hypothetical protein N7495_006181 [Penicillium taxi]|uniref:uncharacterized protein n=1 Tax=Penicillium taxi TaxID=168475 RepID=UPI0025451B11|nr:uncharacterized protein N7495_006181 [Penicillium taxi]KAJ5894490.1 hypothetical protein N7495_006181 [Penicillium taxi]